MTKLFNDCWYYRHPIGANCNVYIFKDGPDLDFIDTGIRRLGVVRWLYREIRKDGLDPRNIRNIYHGHFHFDHVQSDIFFQQQAVRHKGNVKVYSPRRDLYRANPRCSLITTNLQEMQHHFPDTSFDFLTDIINHNKFYLEPLLKCPRPENIMVLENNQTVQIGKRTAKVFTTGGHTEGHSFFFFDDEDKILHTGDHDALNEFTCNWKHTIESVRLAQKLSPDTVFIGHNAAKLGHEKAMGFVNSYFKQFDKIFAPLVSRFRKGQVVNLTRIAYARMGWIGKIKPAVLWAHMGLYAICKYFEELNIGKLEIRPPGHMVFKITGDPEKIDLLRAIRYGTP